jgi:hypothetical protein
MRNKKRLQCINFRNWFLHIELRKNINKYFFYKLSKLVSGSEL